MIDLMCLTMLGWVGIWGWHRGFWRVLMDSMSLGVSTVFASISLPVMKDVIIDGELGTRIRHWIRMQITEGIVPTSSGDWAVITWHSDEMYRWMWTIAVILTLAIGIQMILFVYQTLWGISIRQNHRWLGMGIGMTVGIVLIPLFLQAAGAIAWVFGWESLDGTITRSVIGYTLIHLFSW